MVVLKLINNSGHSDEKNLCFVNASLQLLYAIPEVRNFFKDRAYRTDTPLRFPISDELSRIFRMTGEFSTSAAEIRRLTAHHHGRQDICSGNQQDMEEFTRLLLECLEHELKNVNESSANFLSKFIGMDMDMKLFLTADGACQKGHRPRNEPQIFRTIKLVVPDTERNLSLNNMVYNHYSMGSESIMMKCSDCCPHLSNCPLTNECKLRNAAEKKCLLSAPTFLYIQLLRFSDIHRKIMSRVIPENVLVLPNEDKFKLISIGNHLGSLPTNGHYQVLVKSEQMSWVMANDDKNYKTTIKDQISADNYIFLYKKFSTKSQFVPSQHWEEVLEDQPVPSGLHIQEHNRKPKKAKEIIKTEDHPSVCTQEKEEVQITQKPEERESLKVTGKKVQNPIDEKEIDSTSNRKEDCMHILFKNVCKN